jgi:predicted Rossmann fold nucleotide-binding protein DprA/Smf involved in DNA uptake
MQKNLLTLWEVPVEESRLMKAAPIALPASLQTRLGADAPALFMAVGNTALLAVPLLGLIASRECPGHVLLQTLELATQWARAGQVILSGFHSPLEQQVLRSMLRRQGRVVKLLGHALDHYSAPAEEQAPLAEGRLLVLSACRPSVTRTTRATALARNRLVLALAAEHCVPYLSPQSPLHGMGVFSVAR